MRASTAGGTTTRRSAPIKAFNDENVVVDGDTSAPRDYHAPEYILVEDDESLVIVEGELR
jgi:hypothetical protein